MNQLILITGPTSGIGRELALIAAQRNYDLILVARNPDKLNQIIAELQAINQIKVYPIIADLSDPKAADQVFAHLQKSSLLPEILINNAGFGDLTLFSTQDPAKIEQMINLNILTLTKLTRFLLPQMIARGSGRILNLASVASFFPGPLQAVYFATKAYVLSLSEALANELAASGVTVTALCPGGTKTNFAKVAHATQLKNFRQGDCASDVAKFGFEAMLRGQRVAIYGFKNKLLTLLFPKILPRKVVANLVRRSMEK
jgi:short-subunit dehydrogenase